MCQENIKGPKVIKQTLKECWAILDNKKSFAQALEQQGVYLAKGDRHGFVVVDWRGEVYSLSRWLDIKTKILKQRLGEPENLTSVDMVKSNLDEKLAQRIKAMSKEIKQNHQRHFSPLLARKKEMLKRHQQTRKLLADKQSKRQQQEEAKKQQSRLKKGFRSVWDRLTVKHGQVQKLNEMEVYKSYLRDQVEKDTITFRQLEERSTLQHRLDELQVNQQEEINKIKEALFSKLPEEKIIQLRHEFDQPLQNNRNYDLEM